MEQIDYAIQNKLPIEAVLIDSGLYADYVLQHIMANQLKFVAGINIKTLISVNHEERLNIKNYLSSFSGVHICNNFILLFKTHLIKIFLDLLLLF